MRMDPSSVIKEDIFDAAESEENVDRADREEKAEDEDVKIRSLADVRQPAEDESILAEVFQSTSAIVAARESLVQLSSTKLYGDIYELEKSDMDISDSETRGYGSKNNRLNENGHVSPILTDPKPKQDGYTAEDLEEGEILELMPPAEDVAMLNVSKDVVANEKQKPTTPEVQEYYDRLGKIFSEAKRMSLEIQKGFSQLFTDDQLKALEKQMNEISQQSTRNISETNEKPKSKSTVTTAHTSSKTKSRSRGRRYNRSSRSHRSSRRRRRSSSRRRSRSKSVRSRRHARSHGTQKDYYDKEDKDHTSQSQSRPDRDRSNPRRSSPRSKPSDVHRKSSPRSFLRDDRTNVSSKTDPKPPSVPDGKEKERVKTLVNRQMKFITQHMDNKNAKPIPAGNKWDIENRSPSRERSLKSSNHRETLSKPTDIRCLQDLEYFMDLLRAKNSNKNMSDEDIFAQLNQMRRKSNTKENVLPSDQDMQMEDMLKEMANFPEKSKGLYFQSSKSKFKDTFTEQDGRGSPKSGREMRNARTNQNANVKKNVLRTPVKFEMKKFKSMKTKRSSNLFSDSDSNKSFRSRNSYRSRSVSDSTDEDKRNRGRSYSPESRRRNRDDTYSDSSRSRSNSCDRRGKQSRTEQNTRKLRSLSSSPLKNSDCELKSPTPSRKRSIERENPGVSPSLESKRQKLLKEYADIQTKLDEQNSDKIAESGTDDSSDESTKDERKRKQKPSKKIVIIGNKDDLDKLIITPALHESLVSGTLKRTVLMKLVKHKDKRKTIEEVKDENPKVVNNTEEDPQSETTLEELEAFMDDLRMKQKPQTNDETEGQLVISDFTARESRFLDRHKAKRKAKLMACTALPDKVANKEARLLESMRRRNSDDGSEMSKVLQRLKAENDAVMMCTNQPIPKTDLVKVTPDTLPDYAISSIPVPDEHILPSTTAVVKENFFLSSKAQSLLNRAKKTNNAVRGRKKHVPLPRKVEPEQLATVVSDEELYP